MNGAELPCGSIIHVEPARSNRNNNDTTGTNDHYGPATTQSGTATHVARDVDNKKKSTANPVAEEEDDDLDNFFNSL